MKEMGSIHVALVDDHTLVRKGLVEIVDGLGPYKVVLQAGNGREFQELYRTVSRIDIAIVDLKMPIMDGFATIAWINAHCPGTLAMALTFESSEDAVVLAMRNGARGFVLKDIEPAELRMALDQIHSTGYYHTELVHRGLMNNVDQLTGAERAQARLLESITAREREFLEHLCRPEEYTYEGIAAAMGVHRRTVDGYREHLFEKFGMKSKTGLVLFAIKAGVVRL